MNNLAILGSKKHHPAVIDILTKLGGQNPYQHQGTDESSFYFIDSCGNIVCKKIAPDETIKLQLDRWGILELHETKLENKLERIFNILTPNHIIIFMLVWAKLTGRFDHSWWLVFIPVYIQVIALSFSSAFYKIIRK